MIKQKVVRTYPHGWGTTTGYLTKLLDKGYKVVYITPVNKGIIEYIVEKEISEGSQNV